MLLYRMIVRSGFAASWVSLKRCHLLKPEIALRLLAGSDDGACGDIAMAVENGSLDHTMLTDDAIWKDNAFIHGRALIRYNIGV